MIELPEAYVLCEQLNESIKGKVVAEVEVNRHPHKFAWFYGDPDEYQARLNGKKFVSANPCGGLVELHFEDIIVLFGDAIILTYHLTPESLPEIRQLKITFSDGSALAACVRLYGGLWCFKEGTNDNPYYLVAKQKVSPYEPDFDRAYFEDILNQEGVSLMPVKKALATEQRIPGLGNGVLQDILWKAEINPKTKIKYLEEPERAGLFNALKNVLFEMREKGGRDKEFMLYGDYGRYHPVLSSSTVGTICPRCGEPIQKINFMGGSNYFCPQCQPEKGAKYERKK